ncbi:MAG: thiamine-phosphate kinase [Desulfovibrionaceae bacterium]|nr:thiamine-phosphate kinase [Desulfovibrionaceae bacterium]
MPGPSPYATARPLSEDSILACLGRHFPQTHPALILGRGDDCAVLRASRPLCMSSDLFLEDIHFRRSYFSPADTGYKALAVNISDLAACGAKPLAFALNLGLPDWVDMPWLESLFGAMAALAGQYGMALAGGDLCRCPALHISITVWGETPEQRAFLARGGSMPGDILFVVGPLGLARVGLAMLEELGPRAVEAWPVSCAAHLRPQPQVDAGRMLARAGYNARPPALMDLSDGLARDLPRLLGLSGELAAGGRRNGQKSHALGASLILPQGLLHPELIRFAAAKGRNPVHEAILGGEDYALLGACAPDMLPALHAAIPTLCSIGTVTAGGGILCNNESLEGLCGFDHFERQAGEIEAARTATEGEGK